MTSVDTFSTYAGDYVEDPGGGLLNPDQNFSGESILEVGCNATLFSNCTAPELTDPPRDFAVKVIIGVVLTLIILATIIEKMSQERTGFQTIDYCERCNYEDITLDEEVVAEPSNPIKHTTTNELSRESVAQLMDSIIVNNDKVRYYYNKTLFLREPLGNISDMLEGLHSSTFSYLSQYPETGDYSIISTLFELIPTISVMIDWENLNHTCYWEDFCRETRQLMHLLDKVNGAALKCSDTVTELLRQAQEIFSDAVDSNSQQRTLKIEKAIALRKETDYIHENTTSQNIQIQWQKPGDTIELMWHDADGGLLSVSLKQTGIGFRLRFLRHIVYHTHALLEKAYLTFMKLNVALHLHIPIEKLEKCRDVNLKQLTLQELACLTKAKREFDSSLDTIWQMISRYKFQASHLFNHTAAFKGMRKSSGYTPKPTPTFALLKMSFNDSLLLRVMSSGIQAEANEESFDFTVFPDRTEDIVAKIEDLLSVDTTSYRELLVLINIVKIILPLEQPNFTLKEKASTSDEIARILAHRFQVRRSLKKAVEMFEKHSAFYKMEQLKLLPPMKHMSSRVQSFEQYLADSSCGSESKMGLEEIVSSIIKRDGNNNDEDPVWISVEGGVQITVSSMGILTKYPGPISTTKNFIDLSTDERVILCVRVIRKLLVNIANEQCIAKISSGTVAETKSLVKRLKVKDRQNVDLQKVILEYNKHLRRMLQLTKTMRFLKL